MRANEFITESSPILVNPVVKNNANAMAVIKHLFNKESKWRIGHQADLHEVDLPTQSNFIVGPKGAVFFQRRLKYIVSSIKNKLTVKVTTSVKLDIDKIALLVGSPTKYYSVDTGQVLHKSTPPDNTPINYGFDPMFYKLYAMIVEKIYSHYELVGEIPEVVEHIYNIIPTDTDLANRSLALWGTDFGKAFQRAFYDTFLSHINEVFEFHASPTNPVNVYPEAIKKNKRLLYNELAKFIRKFIIVFISQNESN